MPRDRHLRTAARIVPDTAATMRRVIVFAAIVVPAAAQTVPFVQFVPALAPTIEGPVSTGLPFGSALARHALFAYDGSARDFQHTMRITAIELRPEGGPLGAVRVHAAPDDHGAGMAHGSGRGVQWWPPQRHDRVVDVVANRGDDEQLRRQ